MRYKCEIRWKDSDEICDGYIISDEDSLEDDENTFFYVEGEYVLKNMIKNGSTEDFDLISYEVIS